MTTSSSRSDAYILLREDALLNIERLFDLWNLDWKKINDVEYDFRNPNRHDRHFGAVRFNVEKGIGADFANTGFTEDEMSGFGHGFDRTDFGFSSNKAVREGFDIIGLCKTIHNLASYKDAAKLLASHLRQLNAESKIAKARPDAHILREQRLAEQRAAKKKFAYNILSHCAKYKGTKAEDYLRGRGIVIKYDEPNIRFHPTVMCVEAKKYLPAIVFPIQAAPLSEVVGIHRIYLDEHSNRKAPITEPKLAIGEVKGNGIWFGKPGKTLYIAEGPENALTLIHKGAEFVVCTVYSTNFANLTIPKYVDTLIICPDPDSAGEKACFKAKRAYALPNRKIEVKYPKNVILPNGKRADLNDIHMISLGLLRV